MVMMAITMSSSIKVKIRLFMKLSFLSLFPFNCTW